MLIPSPTAIDLSLRPCHQSVNTQYFHQFMQWFNFLISHYGIIWSLTSAPKGPLTTTTTIFSPVQPQIRNLPCLVKTEFIKQQSCKMKSFIINFTSTAELPYLSNSTSVSSSPKQWNTVDFPVAFLVPLTPLVSKEA